MHRRSQIALAAFAMASIAMAGCGGHAGSPLPFTSGTQDKSKIAPHTASATASASASLFHPNTEKYSDAGSHPVTGRSGSAVINSRALLAKDGTTLVEATTGTLDAQPGPGNIRHVTTTVTTVDGTAQPTNAYNGLSGGYWNHTYSGLARNETIKVDTNVRDIDPRNDAVTTIDSVKLRPDLAATSLSGPARAYRNKPVTFTAVVHEANGDVGAHADCVLSADGQQVDQAQGIWVDAGSTVSCAFQTTFATLGTHHVSVAVTNVVPGDWDLSNNHAETTIEIVDPIVNLRTYAYARSLNFEQSGNQTYSDYYSRWNNTYDYKWHYDSGYMDGYSQEEAFQFPIASGSATITADGSPVLQQNLTSFSPAYNYGGDTCSYVYAPGMWGSVCSQSANGRSWTHTYLNWYRQGATYYSKTTVTTCSYFGCTPNSYVYYYQWGDNNGFSLGNVNVFAMKFTDGAGTQYVGQTAPATAQTYSYSQPYSYCYNYWNWYYPSEQYCNTGRDTRLDRFVLAYGSGT